jgi:hypothetical protein
VPKNNSGRTELDGVQTATVDFDTKLATVTLIKQYKHLKA